MSRIILPSSAEKISMNLVMAPSIRVAMNTKTWGTPGINWSGSWFAAKFVFFT